MKGQQHLLSKWKKDKWKEEHWSPAVSDVKLTDITGDFFKKRK